MKRFGIEGASRRLSRGTGEVKFGDGDSSEAQDAAGYVAQDGIVHPAPTVRPARQGVDSRHPYVPDLPA